MMKQLKNFLFNHDGTPYEHPVIGACLTALAASLGGLLGSLGTGVWVGSFLQLGVFLGREIAQAEKADIAYGRYPEWAKNKWYKGLFFWRWSVGNKQDLFYILLPMPLYIALAAWLT